MPDEIFLQQLKKHNRLEEVMAEDGIELKPFGGELAGHHANKHEGGSKVSLRVDPRTQLYFCSYCGEGGDVIRWVESSRGMSFDEACRYLARRAGIDRPETEFDPEAALEEITAAMLENYPSGAVLWALDYRPELKQALDEAERRVTEAYRKRNPAELREAIAEYKKARNALVDAYQAATGERR